jgi:hypothetical protein
MSINRTSTRDQSPISDIAPEVPKSDVAAARPRATALTEDEIRARAYERYLDRGSVDGAADEDWLAAEAQLRGRDDG